MTLDMRYLFGAAMALGMVAVLISDPDTFGTWWRIVSLVIMAAGVVVLGGRAFIEYRRTRRPPNSAPSDQTT